MISIDSSTPLANPAHYRLIFDIDLAKRDHPELAGEATAACQLLLQSVLDGLAAGVPPAAAPPRRLAALLLASTHGLVDLWNLGTAPREGRGDPHKLIRLLLTSIRGQLDRQ